MKKFLIITLVLCIALTSVFLIVAAGDRDRMRFVEVMNKLANNDLEFIPDKIIISTNPGSPHLGRNLIVEESSAIRLILERFKDAKLSETYEYKFGSDHIKPAHLGIRIKVSIYHKSDEYSGFVYTGGTVTEGIGFMIESKDDIHWLNGAWDPYPSNSYWFPMLPLQWILNPPVDSKYEPLYEMFAYLFLLTNSYNKTEYQFNASGRNLIAISEGDRLHIKNLLVSTSINEYLLKNPESKSNFLRFDEIVNLNN
jgi:hypothetical protein